MSEKLKTPWHLWVVGIITFIWNCGGAVDYFMTQTRNEGYMSAFTEAQLDYFYTLPAWYIAFWAIGVWFSLLGSILLLLRMKLALPVYLLSLLGLLVGIVYGYVLDVMPGVNAGNYIFTAAILIILLAQIWYSNLMQKRGILR